jgi:hypothetical protein
MSDAPNPQLVVGWTVQNQGAAGPMLLVSSEGPGDGGGPASLVATPAARVAAASLAGTSATTAVITATALAGADSSNLTKLTDFQAAVTSFNTAIGVLNAEIAALKAAGLQQS